MFTLVHSGNTYLVRGGLAIYVKMKQRKGSYYELQTPNGTYVKLKDREVFITKRGFAEYNVPMFLENYDYAVNCDIANNNSAVPSPGIMFITDRPTVNAYDKSIFLPRKMFIDSGGFLLLVGTADFIDPKELALYYNKYANLGMALDIPLGNPRLHTMERGIFHAHVQRLNTEIIKKNLDSSVTLYNICHGATPEIRKRYIEIVKDNDLEHWSCPCPSGTLFDKLLNVLVTIDNAGTKVKSMHVFGVASPISIPMLAWLGKYLDISSDASSAMRVAKNFMMTELHGIKMSNASYVGNKKVDYGKIKTKDFSSKMMCGCNVCHALGTSEVFHHLGKHKASAAHVELLWLHNSFIYDEYTEMWNSLAKECSIKEYKEQYARVLSAENKHNVKLIDAIELWKEHDSTRVLKTYALYLQDSLGKHALKAGDPKKFSLATPAEDNLAGIRKTLDNCAKRYLKFYGNKLKKYAGYLMT